MTKSTLVHPHGTIRLSTCHIWNFKSKEQKTYISSFSEKLKKEATQSAWVSVHSVSFLLPLGLGVVTGWACVCHLRVEGHAWQQIQVLWLSQECHPVVVLSAHRDPVQMKSGKGWLEDK